jgi:hypothetical protein
LVPSHVAWLAPVGTGQGAQDVPQALTDMAGWQRPVQLCCPVGQTPEQAVLWSIQMPAQSFLPVAQAPPHDLPSHVAVPSVGATQGVQEVPQLRMLVSSTHPPGHVCWPAGQPEAAASAPASLSIAAESPESSLSAAASDG